MPRQTRVSDSSEALVFSAFSHTSPSLRKGFRIVLPTRRHLLNSVGYQNLGVKSSDQYNYKVATFDKVDGSVTKLGDVGVDENFAMSYLSFLNPNGTTKTFEIQEILDEGGMPVFGFNYLNAEAAEEAGLEAPGWYYLDGEYTFAYYPFNDLDVPFGSMFYIEAEGEANVVVSGVVADQAQPIDVSSSKQYNYTGNCSPVEITLGDVGVSEEFSMSYLSFLNPNGTTKTFEIQEILDEGGMPVFGFNYLNEEAAEEAGLAAPGWYYLDGEYTFAYYPFNALKIAAGEMFYIEAEADAQVIIPSAL